MTYEQVIKHTFKKFLLPTTAITMGITLMNIANFLLALLLFGNEGSFVIGICLPFVIFVEMINYLFGVGSGIAISICQGKRDKQRASEIFTFSVLAILVIGIIMQAVILAYFPQFLAALGAVTAEQQKTVGPYLLVLCCGLPILMESSVLNTIIRNDNHPRYAMLGVLSSVAVYFLLAAILIGGFHAPLFAIALANVLSQLTSMIIYICYFLKKDSMIHLVKRINLSVLKDIFKPGISGSTIFFMQTILTLFINSILMSSLGEAGVSAYGNFKYSLVFIFAVYDSINLSAQPMLGVYFGNGDIESLRMAARLVLRVIGLCGVALCVVFAGISCIIPQSYAMMVMPVRFVAVSCLFSSFNSFWNFYYRSIGNISLPMAVSILNNFVIPAVFILLFCKLSGLYNYGIWLSLLCSEVLTFTILYLVRQKNPPLKKEGEEMKREEFKVLIQNKEEDITAIVSDIEAFCNEQGIAIKKQYYIQLCIEELVVNIIRYGFKDGTKHYIDIRIREDEGDAILNIRDDAVQFDPTTRKKADVTLSAEQRDIGGLGIHLVRTVAKEFTYNRIIGMNNLYIRL